MNDLKSLKEQLGEVQRSLNAFDSLDNPNADEVKRAQEDLEVRDSLESQIQVLELKEKARRANALRANESNLITTTYRSAVAPSYTDWNNAMKAWVFRKSGNDHLITSAIGNAADKCGINQYTGEQSVVRAQSKTVGEGGYTVDALPNQPIIKSEKWFGPMRQVARVVQTQTGASLPWPTCDDTSNVGAIVGENSPMSNVSVSFNTKSVGAFKYTSLVQPISVELLQDSGFDFLGFVSELLNERVYRKQNADFTTGGGTTLPFGVATSSSLGKAAADYDDITLAELRDLEHSLDKSYRDRASYMMHDSTWKYIKALLDTAGQTIHVPTYFNGFPYQLNGYPVIINNDMDTLAASKKVVLFGDFSWYLIRDVMQNQIKVLNELYAASGAVGICVLARADGVLLNTSAVKHLITDDNA